MRDKDKAKRTITIKYFFSKEGKDVGEIIKKTFTSYIKSEVSKTRP